MLDMPSAHMAPDAQLAFSIGGIDKVMRFAINFQALPWLETSFRYSHFAPGSQNYDRSFSLKARLLAEEHGFADVSVGARDLLGTGVYSAEYIAASKHIGPFDLTFGIGWGRLASLAALPNPLGLFSSALKTRGQPSSAATGGDFNFTQYFRGQNIGIFGGAIWNTPIEGLDVIMEYSSDRYVRERAGEPRFFQVNSPVNIGVSYTFNDYASVGAGWYYGSTYGFTVTFFGDVSTPNHVDRIGPQVPIATVRTEVQQRQALTTFMEGRSRNAQIWKPPTAAERTVMPLQQALMSGGRGVRDVDMQGATLIIDAHVRSDAETQCAEYSRIVSATGTAATSIAMSDFSDGSDQVIFCRVTSTRSRYAPPAVQSGSVKPNLLERTLQKSLKEQDLRLSVVSAAGGELWLYYENGRYFHESEALGRVMRILMRDAPSTVELFHIFPLLKGTTPREIAVSRSAMERLAQSYGSMSELGDAINVRAAALDQPALDKAESRIYPRLTWSFGPQIGEQLFDPDEPLQVMLFMEGSANLQLTKGLSIGTALTSTIVSNYNTKRRGISALPHVRTDQNRYQDEGVHGITYLAASYLSRLTPEVFAEIKAGYLEDMFAGVGGQLLWRPSASRFAVGADLYQVWQREFNRLLGLQSYNVVTGHVSIYYESPWYNLNFAVHGGRYLAGDYGATFEITRRFLTGVEIGAWATFTNVPFSVFGEGSFDKGIVIRIPLEWGLPFFTTSTYNLNLRSLTRDGGQRLQGDNSLYYATQRTSYNEIMEHLERIARP